MQESLKVFAPTCPVVMGPNIVGHIVAVQIDESGVMYQVSWWIDKDRKEQWLWAFEVCPLEDPKELEVGFHTINTGDRNGKQSTH